MSNNVVVLTASKVLIKNFFCQSQIAFVSNSTRGFKASKNIYVKRNGLRARINMVTSKTEENIKYKDLKKIEKIGVKLESCRALKARKPLTASVQ